MLSEMPNWLFHDWMVYDSFDPINQSMRGEWSTARLMALLANMNRGKHKRPYEIRQFIPEYGPIKKIEPRKAQDLYNDFRSWAIGAGAKPPKN
jgi:hypothetical protein